MKPFAWLGLILAAVVAGLLLFWVWRKYGHRWLKQGGTGTSTPLKLVGSRLENARERVANEAKKVRAGVVLPLVLLVAFASQLAFDSGGSGRNWGIILFLALFPVTWLFAYLESRYPESRITEHPGVDWSPRPSAFFESVTEQPWRTFLGTLSLIVILFCVSLSRDKENNLAAGITWLLGLSLFLVACSPGGWLSRPTRLKETLHRHWLGLLLITGILVAGLFARLYELDQIPVEQDEGQFGIDVLELMEGEKSFHLFGTARFDLHPAVFPHLQAASMAVFGKNTVGLRVPSVIVGSLNLLLMYLLARRMFGHGLALVAVTLFAFVPAHLAFSRTGTYDMIVVPFAITPVLYFLYRGLHSRRIWDYAAAGVSFGLGLWLDYDNKSMVLIAIVGVVFLYLVATRWHYWRSEYPKLGIFLAGAVIVMLPVWSTYAHTHQLWGDMTRGRFIFSPSNLGHVQHVLGTSDTILIIARQVERSIFGLNHFGDSSPFAVPSQHGMLDSLTAIFFFIGLAYTVWRWREPRYGIVLLSWGVGLQATIWSINPPSFNRLAMVLPPTCLMAAIGMERIGRTWAKMLHWDRGIYLGVIAALLLGNTSYTNLSAYFSPESIPSLWKEMAEVGRAIKVWSPEYDIYYLGAPWVYARGYGTILFHSQRTSLSAMDVGDVRTVVPLREEATRDVAFIIAPRHFGDLDYIQEHYPHGVLKEWYDEYRDRVYLKAYLVSQAEANNPAVSSRQLSEEGGRAPD